MITVLALDKKHFGHYALFKIFYLRSPSDVGQSEADLAARFNIAHQNIDF